MLMEWIEWGVWGVPPVYNKRLAPGRIDIKKILWYEWNERYEGYTLNISELPIINSSKFGILSMSQYECIKKIKSTKKCNACKIDLN